jgi:ribonuclease G
MQSPGDNAQLLYVLKSLVKRDKVKTTVVDMTPLGLVEITRKKISKPLREQLHFSDVL